MDGVPLQEAGVGQPFLLHVNITHATNTAQYPLIKNIENFQVHHNGFQMNMVNGTTSIVYHYRIRIDNAGTYTLGPAQITHENTIIESPPITITVTQEQKVIPINSKQAKTQSHSSILRLTCNKDKAVVGEKLQCTLTFYTSDPTASLQALVDPDQANAACYTIQQRQGPFTGTKMIQGVEHRYAQWQWDLYPTKPGMCIIPAYAADFVLQSHSNFFSLFLGRSDTKRIYSNTLSIPVDALPAHKEPITFIGSVQEFSAKIDPLSAKVGQGIVLTLTITGEGNFEQLQLLALQQIDKDLKWYESKQYVQPSALYPSMITHTMEYIIQALQPGTYEIPGQELHYFDTTDRIYKTKKTVPLTIQIMPGIPTSAPITSTPEPKESLATPPTALKTSWQQNAWFTAWPFIIPWPLFWALSTLLFLVWLLIIMSTIYRKHFEKLNARWFKKSAYKRTRNQLKIACKTNNYGQLYTIFINFLATHFSVPPSSISSESIEQLLVHTHFSNTALQDWRQFFYHLAQVRFYQKTDTALYKNIQNQTLYWIDIFEKSKKEGRIK